MKKYLVLLILYFPGLIWSGIRPFSFYTWLGEIASTVIGLLVILFTFRRFRLSYVTYIIILISCYFIFIGAHYTFSREPLFNYLRELFGWSRNNYDKLGHFIQGIAPFLITREVLLRKKITPPGLWTNFLALNVCMATTAVYEVLEYLVCAYVPLDTSLFLGMQGFVWDSQTDMLAAAMGGLFSAAFLTRWQNRQLLKEFPEFGK